jgi:hypothetical protein
MRAQAARQRPREVPEHEYAVGHHLLLAAKEYGNKRRLRKVEDLRASGEVACERVKEFAYDLGAELEFVYGWKASAARRMGLTYSTMWNIIMGDITAISTKTVDHVARHSGIPVSVFYDPEL